MSDLPISDYGFIGNLASCALVGRSGSIDWCCLPSLDSPSVFGAILDHTSGGRFRIAVDGAGCGTQHYLPDTNVLVTTFRTQAGTVEILDWMHLGPFSDTVQEHHRTPAIFRRIRCIQGALAVHIDIDPRTDYARASTVLTATDDGLLISSASDTLHLFTACPLTIDRHGAHTVHSMREGEQLDLLLVYGSADRSQLPSVDESLHQTIRFWRTWVSHAEPALRSFSAPLRDAVVRSSLVLKILAGGKDGGIAAAATTSLPEVLGGAENWDYRFNWIRDTSFTVQALSALGHTTDAREFLLWIEELLSQTGRRPSDLRVLYPLRSGVSLVEEELSHLAGYAGSRPVRIGNGASDQRQLDIYGELLDTVYRAEYLHPVVGDRLAILLADLVTYVCDAWREPDFGIWELRQEPRHHVYSKVMCWVAIDRGIRLATEHGWPVDLDRWRREADAIKTMVLDRGFHKKRGSFVQSFDAEDIDATALLLPLLEFLPPDDPRVQSTLRVVENELSHGPFVYRSSAHVGREGAFGLCGFWLVDALAIAGRLAEAEERFQALLRSANHVGLYAEQCDPETGAFLGNFPQAFTHVGLINSALYLTRLRTTVVPEHPLMGEESADPHAVAPQSETRITLADTLRDDSPPSA